MYIKDIQDACRRVLKGAEDALEELGLDNVTYPRPKAHNTANTTLQITYSGVLHTAVAARELNLWLLEKQCQTTLEMIQAIAAAKKTTLLHEIDGRDVAEIMLSLIDEELHRHGAKEPGEQQSESEEQEQRETAVEEAKEDSDLKEIPPAKKKTTKRVVQTDQVESDKCQEESEDNPIKDAPPAKKKKKTTKRVVQKRKAFDFTIATVQGKISESVESEEENEEEISDSENDEQDSEEEEAGTRAVGPSKRKSLTHHLVRKCIVGKKCNYQGPNLKRHLRNVHVNKGDIDESQVERFFSMGFKGSKKRGPTIMIKGGKKVKGRWKRWCPEPDCNYLGAYLSHHLQNKHHLNPTSSKYKTALKIAVRYKGVTEELEMMKTSKEQPTSEDSSTEEQEPMETSKKRPASEDPPTPPPKKQRPKTKPAQETASASPSCTAADQPESKASSHADESDDDSDEDDDAYPMAADYFQEKNPKTNRHKWLVHFYRYLFTPTAGFHKDRNRLQHACQVRRLLEESDPNGNDISFIADDECNRVWIDWVVPNLRKKRPGTVKSYLTSFEIFLEYVSKKGTRPYLPVLEPEVKNNLFDLSNSLNKWRRCVTKETASDKWDRYLDETDHLLTNEEVQDIMTSKPAVDGRAALVAADQADDVSDLTLRQYCDARDYLIVTLTRAVGTRPAPLENATIRMFQSATWDDNKQRKVMMVSSHKREEDGPAPIPMAPDTEFLVSTFITKLRPLVADDSRPDAKIFLKADGAPFHKGTIGRRVSAFVVKSGIRPDKAISATDFRKWIVTELKRKKRLGIPIDEQLLRRLMCHSDKTANEWYLRESLAHEATAASMMIEEFTKPSSSKDQDAGSSKEKSLSTKSMKQVGKKVSSEIDDTRSKDESAASQTSGSSKRSLTAKHHEAIKQAFAEDIKNGVEPKKNRVVAVMKSDLLLRTLVNSEPLVKKVIDRARYLVQQRPTMLPEDLPEETASTRTAAFVQTVPDRPPSSIESGRVEWSDEETMAIREALTITGYTKCPNNEQIRQLFKRTSVLTSIMKGNTFERVRNKVKNEFRKLKD